MQASERSVDNNLGYPCPLWSGWHGVPVFHKEFQIVAHLTTDQSSILPHSILNDPWPSANVWACGACLEMASSLHCRVSAGNGGWHGGLCSLTMLSGSIPDAHSVISLTVAFLFEVQWRLRARRSRASSRVLQPWPLCTAIVPDSLSLLMMLCVMHGWW